MAATSQFIGIMEVPRTSLVRHQITKNSPIAIQEYRSVEPSRHLQIQESIQTGAIT